MNPGKRSRIAVVGCGAIGQFFAAQLAWANHTLLLLARRDSAVLAERGIRVLQRPVPQIKSSLSSSLLHIAPSRLVVATRPQDLVSGGFPDWVLVALKTTALEDAQALVAPLVDSNTRIVILCNGLGVEERFVQWFGPERIFGMLCFVAVNRDDDATIRHLAYGHVGIGHYLDDPSESANLRQLFEDAGVQCEQPRALLEARWRKMTWNVPFNGLCLLHDCTTDRILTSPDRRAMALALAHETVRVANDDLATQGRNAFIEEPWAELQIARTDTMGAYAPSTLLDARAGRPLEVDVMFLEVARRAKRLGSSVPTLERLIDGLRDRGLVSSESD